MSYKEQLQANNTEINANNTDIQTAIDLVNALPDAGSTSIDTCTVTFDATELSIVAAAWVRLYYTALVDGVLSAASFGTEELVHNGKTVTFQAVCGTPVFFYQSWDEESMAFTIVDNDTHSEYEDVEYLSTDLSCSTMAAIITLPQEPTTLDLQVGL